MFEMMNISNNLSNLDITNSYKMPHIVIKMYKGETEEQKAKLADEVSKTIMNVLGKSEASISIAIEDVEASQWMDKVYNVEIKPGLEKLYKKPGY